MGLKWGEFWSLTWYEYECLCDGFRIKNELEWSRTRELVAVILNVNRGKNMAVKTGRDIIPLSIDEPIEPVKPLTIEEHNELIKLLDGKTD